MNITDLSRETITAVSANKTRSGLTILGIVIGIASVIAMISIGQGAQSSIQSSIQSLGSNLLQVLPGQIRGIGNQVSSGSGSAQSLTIEDSQAITSQVANVSATTLEVSGRYQVTAAGTNTRTTVDGTSENYTKVRNLQIDTGTYFTDSQSDSLSKVAVIGPTVVTDLFPDGSDPLGQTITVKGIQFSVIGVTASKGGSGFGSQDDMIFVPLKSAQRFLSGNANLTNIDVQISDAATMTQAQNDVTDLLLTRHNITDPTKADFSVLNQADILATASSITQTFTILLAAIGGISLVVGGIGIMNMMLTTVTERTKEIGLRKAIGATASDINRQFLAEAILLTLIGGVIGIIIGCLISYGINASGAIKTQISLLSIVVAFGVSAAIGVVFGYYPARRASKLNPIDALRYE
jgi:putative ABC transport system permease protein